MKIVFVSNYMNHHQRPLSEALYELTGHDYFFIQTEPMTRERIDMGWDPTLSSLPFVVSFSEQEDYARKLIREADAVLYTGGGEEAYVKDRLDAGHFTLNYSESIYKEGRYRFISPRGLRKKYADYTKYRKKPAYLLCAGAYVAGDYRLVNAYPKKKLRFGYFPAFEEYEEVHALRNHSTVELLWVARLIDWKHPERVLAVAEAAKKAHLNLHITMIGRGELSEKIQTSIQQKQLSDWITLIPALAPEKVRECMRQADIFLATSDRREGWGAVLNEAMNSGCAVLAARQMGAAPYLIRSGQNGYLYNGNNRNELIKLVQHLCESPEERRRLGSAAYATIRDTWNANVAAKRLYDFCADPAHRIPSFDDKGPLNYA